jgi:hypothetical protein
MPAIDDQAQTRLATAALFAALVRALERRDVVSRPEVEAELDKLYHVIRDYPSDWTGALEALSWAATLLKA